jgi:hypothetical protein
MELTVTAPSEMVIYERNNNLDRRDNLDEIPAEKAVYAIYSRINGRPANCIFISETNNLQSAVRGHFVPAEVNADLRDFMQSIKIKTLVYTLMPESSKEERMKIVNDWKKEMQSKS